MITAIKLSALRSGEYIQMMTDLLSILQGSNPEALRITEPYQRLKALVERMEGVFKLPQGSPKTVDIAMLDARRDDAYNGLQTMVKAFTYHTDASLKAQALLLQTHLSAYGSSIARDNYQSQTTILRNIVDELTTRPHLAAAVDGLQLHYWLHELQTANTLFGDLYIARVNEYAAAPTDNLKDLRAETNKVWYKIRDLLIAYHRIENGAPPFGPTVTYINSLLVQYRNLITKRSSEEEGGNGPALLQETN